MNATATQRPRQRKPRGKPARFVRLVVGLSDEGKNGLVRITVGKQSTDYLLNKIPSDFGEAWRLDKPGTDDTYDLLFENDQDRSCTCPGFSYHGHCKHVSGLLALRKAGKV